MKIIFNFHKFFILLQKVYELLDFLIKEFIRICFERNFQ